MVYYPESAVERAMKVQEVILRAMAKKISWWQAAEILGISDRSMRRWRERYEEWGYDGFYDRRLGQPSPRQVPLAVAAKVFELYREKYFDFNVRHFWEELREEHEIHLSYTWVKRALQGAGLVQKGRQRGVHRRRRPQRPLAGMLLHLDGSSHAWLQEERRYDRLVVLDDATSEVHYAQLVEEESTRTVMAALREVIERKGLFCALSSSFDLQRAGLAAAGVAAAAGKGRGKDGRSAPLENPAGFPLSRSPGDREGLTKPDISRGKKTGRFNLLTTEKKSAVE